MAEVARRQIGSEAAHKLIETYFLYTSRRCLH